MKMGLTAGTISPEGNKITESFCLSEKYSYFINFNYTKKYVHNSRIRYTRLLANEDMK